MKIAEINGLTNTVIKRDATAEEIAQQEVDVIAYAKAKSDEKQAEAKKAQAKAALLERLGITPEEAALLL
jgi:outer membrane protein TolC